MTCTKSITLPSFSEAEADRYWSSVKKDANDRGCWLWTGNTNSKGYGRFYWQKKLYSAHRLAWLLAGRALQTNLNICHTCDNRSCVNPDHLIMADAATNNRDAKLKRNLSGKHAKAKKPYAEFPLFPHATRRWSKKINGKLHYFGSTTDDPNGTGALERFNREWPFLTEGRTPPAIDVGDACTLRTLCNAFLASKQSKLDGGELSQRAFRDYYTTCHKLLDYFGKDRPVDDLRPDDFEGFRATLSKRYGVVSLKNEVNRCRVVFKYAFDQRLIDHPAAYGQSFNRPSSKMLRRARNAAGPKLFTADELHAMLVAATPQIKAMVLLGVNCGFGNTDVATLPESAVDLDVGWIDFPRPKTEICRRCPLWPETIDAIRAALSIRPARHDRDGIGLVFLTRQGRPWVRMNASGHQAGKKPQVPIDALSQRFGKLLRTLEIDGGRRLGFYTLRHVFETVAGESKDQVAVDAIMGHVDPSMAAVYRESISEARLQAVVAVVREWLYGDQVKPKAAKRKRRAKVKLAAKRVTKPRNEGGPSLKLFVG